MKPQYASVFAGMFFLICINSTEILAQNKIKAGFNLGAGVSALHGNNYGFNKFHAHMGLLINYDINEKLKIQPAVLISSKGYARSYIKPTERLSLAYMDLIATLKYFPVKVFFIGGGFYTSGLLSSHYRYLAYSNDYYGEPDVSNIINKRDYGLNGSIGCQFDSGVGFEVSLLYGLKDVFNSNSSDTLAGYDNYPYVIPDEALGKNLVISTSFYYLIGRKAQ